MRPLATVNRSSVPVDRSDNDNAESRIAAPFNGLSSAEMRRKIQEIAEHSGLQREHIAIGAGLAARYRWHTRDHPDRTDSRRNDTNEVHEDDSFLDRVNIETSEVRVSSDEAGILDLEDQKLGYTNFLFKLRAYPQTTFWVVLNCLFGAIVQGLDETAVNGAQVFYSQTFPDLEGKDDSAWKLGMVNAAPYMISAVACLFNDALNQLLRGRRGVIFLTCFISFFSCLAQAFPNTWQVLLVFRLLLGLGIGPKSATIPVYASECMPSQLRGGLVMMWQLGTAFGIMLGFAFGLAFWDIGRSACSGENSEFEHRVTVPCSLNWRLMLAIPMIPPLIPMTYIFTLPESPRFLLQQAVEAVPRITDGDTTRPVAGIQEQIEKRKEYMQKAYSALRRLYPLEIQAYRELARIYVSLQNSQGIDRTWYPNIRQLWKHSRTRHALTASSITMFLQQFCGVNVMAYYSTSVLDSIIPGDSIATRKPFRLSLGFGTLNFVAAIPALFLMDKLGRRTLLLATFPLMAAFLFIIAGLMTQTHSGSTVSEATLGGIVTAMYLFCIAYSVGEGPVPFVYASESMPLQHRDSGMGVVTFINWAFNFTLGISWPSFEEVFGLPGSFAWYGAWCVIGYFLVLFYVRETRGKDLEALEIIFSPSFGQYAKWACSELRHDFRRHILRTTTSHSRSWETVAHDIVGIPSSTEDNDNGTEMEPMRTRSNDLSHSTDSESGDIADARHSLAA